MTLDDLRISKIDIDPELGRTPAEFSFLGTCEDIIGKLRRGRRYDIIRASGLLRHLLSDGEPLMDAANRRFRLKLDFNNAVDESDLAKQVMEILRKHDSFAWIPPIVLMHDKTRPRITRDRFLKTPVVYRSGAPVLTVSDIIDTIAHVYGGVHSGRPKSDEDKAVIAIDEEFIIGGGEPSLQAIVGICIAVLDGLTPLVEAIQADGLEN